MAMAQISEPVSNFFETGIPEINNFYSVEFRANKAELPYQFKIWKAPASPTFILIKQGSDVINWIHTGDVLRLTYYGDDRSFPVQQFPTRILSIHKHDDGRFKGHYMVMLGLVEN